MITDEYPCTLMLQVWRSHWWTQTTALGLCCCCSGCRMAASKPLITACDACISLTANSHCACPFLESGYKVLPKYLALVLLLPPFLMNECVHACVAQVRPHRRYAVLPLNAGQFRAAGLQRLHCAVP